MAIRFIDPPPRFRVGSQCFGVDPLCGENRDTGRICAEVGTVFAYVGIGAGARGGSSQAIAASETGLDCWCIALPTVTGHWDATAPDRQRSNTGLGQIERPFVLCAHRGVEEPAITKAHLRRDMSEESHERLERHPCIDHGGGKSMSELMWGHMADARGIGGTIESMPQSLLGQSSSVMGEEKLRGASIAGVRERPAL